MTLYNLETHAYAYMLDAGIEYYIPDFYGCGKRTLSGWGLCHDEDDREYYGIVLEWLEGAEQMTRQNVTIDHAITLANDLPKSTMRRYFTMILSIVISWCFPVHHVLFGLISHALNSRQQSTLTVKRWRSVALSLPDTYFTILIKGLMNRFVSV